MICLLLFLICNFCVFDQFLHFLMIFVQILQCKSAPFLHFLWEKFCPHWALACNFELGGLLVEAWTCKLDVHTSPGLLCCCAAVLLCCCCCAAAVLLLLLCCCCCCVAAAVLLLLCCCCAAAAVLLCCCCAAVAVLLLCCSGLVWARWPNLTNSFHKPFITLPTPCPPAQNFALAWFVPGGQTSPIPFTSPL